MAELEETLYTTISGDAGVAAIVSTRIFPLAVPKGESLPAVSYQRISTNRNHRLEGDGTKTRPVVQVNAVATTYAQAKALARAIYDALQASSQVVMQVSTFEDRDDDEKEYRVSADYQISFIET